MAFSSLLSRLAAVPDVIVGPLLRLVLADQVSVFFATKSAVKITLEVFDLNGIEPMMRGTRSTVEIAKNLHVVCVTATGRTLVPDTGYTYNAKFGTPGNDTVDVPGRRDLFTDGVIRSIGDDARELLTYPDGPQLPSFLFPPANVSGLRILHGSCRKPHADGGDALAIGDQIIASSFGSGTVRPHQMLLTGDQIYADDVAVTLLFLLQDAAKVLVFPEEKLQVSMDSQGGAPKEETGAHYPPNARRFVMSAAFAEFPPGEADSHLMTFADFVLMYAFAWSDVLWPGLDDLPGFGDAFPTQFQQYKSDKANLFQAVQYGGVRHADVASLIGEQCPNVQNYRRTLRDVRRLLANIPTLTIFDDHEITDDWNLNLAWMKDVLDPATERTRLGRAVVRNGLVAYALFQAWGNTPSQFADTTTPGWKLLTNIAAWTGAATGAEVDALATCVGLPTGFEIHVAAKPSGSLDWHYCHHWAHHQIVVLDTRTERGAVNSWNDPPALIYADTSFEKMARPKPAPGADDLVIVIAPGPVFGVPIHEATGRYLHAPGSTNPAMDPEHWALTPVARETLLAALLSRPTPGGDGIIRSRVVVLGGDVHHGSAVHVRYRATNAFIYNARVEGVLAQLTSSSLKNQGALTFKIESLGFTLLDHGHSLVIPPFLPLTEVSGWANSAGSKMLVGVQTLTGPLALQAPWPIVVNDSPAIFECTYGVPLTEPPSQPLVPSYTLTSTPEWTYQVRPQRGVRVGRGGKGALATAAGNRDQKVRQVVAAAKEHRRFTTNIGTGQSVVGHNNLGDISFVWGVGDSKVVIQDLWWQLEDLPAAAPLTRYELPLANGSTVAALSGIPLDPGNGGRSIGLAALEIGDMILTTTTQLPSLVIRVGTGSPVSHSMLYIGGGRVVEAIQNGVVERSLDEALADGSFAVAVRLQGLSSLRALQVRDFAGLQINKPYDYYYGTIKQALFRLDFLAFCSAKTGDEREACRQWAGRVNLGTGTNDQWFCSELVMASYASAGVPLTSKPVSWIAPGDIVDIALAGSLGYVGHLKTSP